MFRVLLIIAAFAGCSEYDLVGKTNIVPGLDTGTPTEEPESEDPDPEPEPDPDPDTGYFPDCTEFVPGDIPDPEVDEACSREPLVGTFTPVIEWQWSANPIHPGFNQIMSAPVAGNLDDDNGDGLVNTDDVPNVVFTTFSGSAYGSPGTLNAIAGDSPATLWSVNAPGGYPIYGASGVAIGDLEGDGLPDVCVSGTTVSVVCVNGADGSFKWAGGTETYSYGCPAFADLDGDGKSEVIHGRTILDHTGTVRWVGTGGHGGNHSMSFAVDWNGSGTLDVIAGNTVYDLNGTILWSDTNDDSAPAIGDFDLDGTPDLVRAGGGMVRVTLNDGTQLWEQPVVGGGSGGPPTVADFDGDGAPEVGVADLSKYTVFDTDGTVMWSNTVSDYSSSQTGSSVFDFEGDGAAEVVYADEHTLWIFDGATGTVKMEQPGHASGTLMEYPLIVDIDNDGTTEIVVASNNYAFGGWTGITVIGDADDSWMESRPIWNQYAYHITNVEDDGSIPRHPTPNWLTWNNFRAGGTELGPSHWQADLRPTEPQICTDTCWDDLVTLYYPVVNHGLMDAPDVIVSLIRADGTTIRTDSIPLVHSGGVAYVGPVELRSEHWGDGGLRVVVDVPDAISECREFNNEIGLGAWPCEE